MPGKGGVTVPLNWCIFNGFESILHDTISTDRELLKQLPNVYAVCIATRNSNPKTVVAGFFVRTTFSHNDAGFQGALADAMGAIEQFQRFDPDLHSFLPARIGAPLDIPESEMLRVLVSQQLKFTSGGSA